MLVNSCFGKSLTPATLSFLKLRRFVQDGRFRKIAPGSIELTTSFELLAGADTGGMQGMHPRTRPKEVLT